MDRKWTKNGQEMDKKWTKNGQKKFPIFRSGASEASGATITEFMAVPILQGFGQICAIRGLVHMHLKPTLQVFWRCQSYEVLDKFAPLEA